MVSEWTGKHVTYLKIVHGFQKSTVTDSTALDMKLTLEIQFYFYFNYDFWYYILKQKIRSSSVSDLVVFQLCCLFGPMYCFEVKEYIFLLNNNVVISWNVVFFQTSQHIFWGGNTVSHRRKHENGFRWFLHQSINLWKAHKAVWHAQPNLQGAAALSVPKNNSQEITAL